MSPTSPKKEKASVV